MSSDDDIIYYEHAVYVWVDHAEDLEQYAPGGYHPVHIGEEYHGGRYRIVHKPGSGSYSTSVWLARDLQANRFVTLKFMTADQNADSETRIFQPLSISDLSTEHPGRRYVVELLDSFPVRGPNGCHCCLVTEVASPSVGLVKDANNGRLLPMVVARRVASQCVQGLAFIHSCGVVYGDFHHHNILFVLPDFHSWSNEDVYRHFGPPERIEVERTDGQVLTPAAPRYVVREMNPHRLCGLVLHENCSIKITDFGESFHITDQKPQPPRTPIALAAPEIIFKDDDDIGPAVDVWSLACTLYEVLGDRSLFYSFESDRNDIITDMVRMLGKLPMRWWDRWSERSTIFEEKGAFRPGPDMGNRRTVDLRERLGLLRQDEGQGAIRRDLYALEVMFGKMLRYGPKDRVRLQDVVLPF